MDQKNNGVKRGKIEAEGGFLEYESLCASIPVPLMYSNAKCVRLGFDQGSGRDKALINETKLWDRSLTFHSYAYLSLYVCICACTHFYLLFK